MAEATAPATNLETKQPASSPASAAAFGKQPPKPTPVAGKSRAQIAAEKSAADAATAAKATADYNAAENAKPAPSGRQAARAQLAAVLLASHQSIVDKGNPNLTAAAVKLADQLLAAVGA